MSKKTCQIAVIWLIISKGELAIPFLNFQHPHHHHHHHPVHHYHGHRDDREEEDEDDDFEVN
jgi:hypothetical protein